MDNLFNKNINALRTKDADLADKLVNHVIDECPQLINENGAYNFLYKGFKLHNPVSPLGEAKEIFSRTTNTPVSIHLVYGIGLGYLFQVTSANSLGTVILYEPDLNILKMAFNLVDFSDDILKNNVFITDSINKVGSYIYQKSNTKNSPFMIMTTAYRDMGGARLEELIVELQRTVGMFGLDRKYTQEKFYQLFHGLLCNVYYLLDEPPLRTLKDKFKGKTAVVVSAGPTLDRDIEVLKKHRDKYVLIVVGTAMKTLVKHSLEPDFLCIIESFDCSRQIAGLNLENVNFVTEPHSNKNLRLMKFKQRFSHISANMPINVFWSELSEQNIDEYCSKGTVSYTALNTARILGCSKIILVGQDLAYVEGQCYSKDSAYKDLICAYNSETNKWEITAKDFDSYALSLNNSPDPNIRRQSAENRLKNLNKSLYYVKGVNGDYIPTESVYAAFIQPLSEFTTLHPNIEYINASLKGAQINGFKNLALEDALMDSPNISDNEREIEVDYHCDKEMIVNKLVSFEKELGKINSVVEERFKNLRQFNNNLLRHSTINELILKDFKKIVVKYTELSDRYTKANKMYDFITIADKIEIDYAMKMIQKFDIETIKHISEKFLQYYTNAQIRIKDTRYLITLVLGIINESTNSES